MMTNWKETVLFAGNRYISLLQSIETIETNEAPPSRSEHIVVRELQQISTLGDRPHQALREYIPMSTVFGTEEMQTIYTQARQYADSEHSNQTLHFNTEQWGIIRMPTRWVPLVEFETDNGTLLRYTLEHPVLPDSVVSHDTLAISWENVLRAFPDAQDAFTSPTEDLLAVVTDGTLSVYPLSEGEIGDQPLLELDLAPNEQVVMAQWATDNYVPIWIEKANEYLH